MTTFEFTLKFALTDAHADPEGYVALLGEAGCDDALIGIGQKGRLALQFLREAQNAADAVMSAIADVKAAIPDARLIEATPDLVGLSDIAKHLGFSRQNMRKLMLTHQLTFPAPIHEGKSAIWHLAKVLKWFEQGQRKTIDPVLMQIANANMQLNIAKGAINLDPQFQSKVSELMA